MIYPRPESKRFMQYEVYAGSLDDIYSDSKRIVSTLNQYSFCIAEKDPEFKEALQNADILLPDGVAIVAATRLLSGTKIKKIAGSDLHENVLKYYNEIGGACFYLGSSEETLGKITRRLKKEYPSLRVGSHSPSFEAAFSEEENTKMVEIINAFNPDVLFLGMTAPKQEKWAHQFKNKLIVKQICSIGAVFDYYAGNIKRAEKIWINLGLEWFMRLLSEPRRLWKRYLYYGPIFIFGVIKEKFKPGDKGPDSAGLKLQEQSDTIII